MDGVGCRLGVARRAGCAGAPGGQPGWLTYDAEAVDATHKKDVPNGLQERVDPEMLLESWAMKE